jgi:hypothetical protein
MNSKIGRTLTATLSGPLVAAGILLGSMVIGESATANAQPATDGGCSSMPMTNGQDGTAPNALTRAGQVGAAAGPSASDGSMAVNCQPAGHG